MLSAKSSWPAASWPTTRTTTKRLLADIPRDTTANGRALVRKTAIGTILGIMPWKPVLPGRQIRLRPTSRGGQHGPGKTLRAMSANGTRHRELFRDAGAPEGVYVNVFPSHDQIEGFIDHRV